MKLAIVFSNQHGNIMTTTNIFKKETLLNKSI